MDKQITFSRKLNIRYECDVLVAGGGMAGVCAACAAARQGASVILIERFAIAGGNATSGGVHAFCGETAGQGEIFDDLLDALKKFNAIAPYKPYPECEARRFNGAMLSFVLQELLLRNNVKPLLHARLADALADNNGKIDYCVISGQSGLEAIKARQFIDCTGEALLTHYAGFGTMKGRISDNLQLPMSLMFFVRHIKNTAASPALPGGWLEKLQSQEELPMTSIRANGEGSSAIKIKIPGGDSTDTESLSEAEIKARRKMMQVFDYYTRVEKKEWTIDHAAPIIGIREGRRAVGDYILTVDDLRTGRAFEDAVAKGTFYLDGHSPDDEKRTYILPQDQLKVPPYHIPLRSLLVKNARNLCVAGRCFSADQLALSSARVMPTCAMMGQAAGITAAMAALSNSILRDINPLEIKELLKKKGAVLSL